MNDRIPALRSWVLLLAACAIVGLAAPSQTLADHYTVGVIAPLTGLGSSYGLGISQGAEMAAREINAAGGINGHRLRLHVVDDTTDPARSVIMMRRLVTASVNVIVGGWGSPQVLAHMDAAEDSGIPYIIVGATSPAITQTRNRWIFRVIQNDAVSAAQLARLAQATLGLKRIAIINDNNAYGTGSREAFAAELKRHRDEPVALQTYQTADTDFRAQVETVLKSRPDGIAVFGTVPAAAGVVRQAREAGFQGRLMGTGGMANDRLMEMAGQSAEGTLATGFFDEHADPQAKAWADRFRKEFAATQAPQPAQAAWEYRALRQIVVPCLGSASNNRAKLRDCIRDFKGELMGIRGPVNFDPTGQLVQPPLALEVRKGAFITFKAAR